MSFKPVGLKILNAHMYYNDDKIFEDLALELFPGKWTCLLGTSGVGKTTLLKLVAGIFDADKTISSDESTVCTAEIKTSDNLPLAGRIAYMGQEDLLLPWLSILDNVLLGEKLRRTLSDKKIEHAKYLLKEVGLEKVIFSKPKSLSGGMKQRAALARTLMENKPLVLMDEPFSALDAITRYRLRKMSAELLKGRTVLLVTHDPIEAVCLGNYVQIMTGSPAKLKNVGGLSETKIPREPDSKEVLSKYAEIMKYMEEAVHL